MQQKISNLIASRCIDVSLREIPEGATFVETGSGAGCSIFQYALSVTALGKPCRALAIDKSGHDIDAPSVNAASPQPYITAGRCEVKQ
jgi:hypothetical protein